MDPCWSSERGCLNKVGGKWVHAGGVLVEVIVSFAGEMSNLHLESVQFLAAKS